MSDSDERCACGAVLDTVQVAVTRHLRCPECAAERAAASSYEVERGELPPDLTPVRDAARERVSGDETVELGSGEGAVTTPVPFSGPPERETAAEDPEPLPVDTGPSLLDDIRNGLGSLRDRISGSKGEQPASEAPKGEEAAREEAEADAPPASGPSAGADGGSGPVPLGTVIGEKFRVVEVLGAGGMGTVYKAEDTSLERNVALKVLSSELTRNQQFAERFVREAKAVAQLTHPHITTIYQYNRGDHFFAMEYVEGENLAGRVQREGPLPPDLVLEIARQTAQGLKAAASHEIIHRDIKPSNLLLTADGQVKITDFGLAKARASVGRSLELTSTGVVMGTPLFMSPEQGRGTGVDHRSDIYSLGATLFFLLFGSPPFEADTPIAIILKHINDPVRYPPRDEVGEDLRALLGRMLTKSLERRIASYEELLEALDKVGRGESLETEAPTQRIVLSPKPSTAKRSLFKVGKLSVAKTNLKLGRRDKAVSLLTEAVEDGGDPALRAESARLLLEIYESDGDLEGVRRMASIVAEETTDPCMRAYASWKLAELDEQDALADLGRAIERLEGVLAAAPEELPRPVIEERIRRLRERVTAAERDSGTTQVVLGSSPRS